MITEFTELHISLINSSLFLIFILFEKKRREKERKRRVEEREIFLTVLLSASSVLHVYNNWDWVRHKTEVYDSVQVPT